MRNPFVAFLVEKGFISADVGEDLDEAGQFGHEPIGAVAAHHGLLDPDQIDTILDEQRTSRERFGEIAVRLGFLMPEQVDALIQIQRFRNYSEVAEALILAGLLSYEDAVQHLGVFVVGDGEVMEVMVGD